MPYFPATYFIVGYSGLSCVIGIGGIDGSCTCFCFYVSAMFRSIQYDLKKAFEIHAEEDGRWTQFIAILLETENIEYRIFLTYV